MPTTPLRYDNAAQETDPFKRYAPQLDRLQRYAHELLDEFPKENDPRPKRGLQNWRDHFGEHAEQLKAAIADWKYVCVSERSLTGVIWHVAASIVTGARPHPFIEVGTHDRLMLRFGLRTLAKVLSREIEMERAARP